MKNLKHLLFLSILCSLVLFTNCGEGISIGDYNQGGIVFYIFEKGDAGYVAGEVHGLIADPNDLSSSADWNVCYGTKITGAKGYEIGRGNKNTQVILTQCKNRSQFSKDQSAAELCNNSDTRGYHDWFLPSMEELQTMYKNIRQGNEYGLGNIGEFNAEKKYCSSSLVDYVESNRQSYGSESDIWSIDFSTGDNYNWSDSFSYAVRAIRAF
ncbi:DUF1566 domain-containing protein [Cyclobacteriaceae bacterium]|nr:DUF1566 domain-containing protein [Cyclobacteriaceae bacterium]